MPRSLLCALTRCQPTQVSVFGEAAPSTADTLYNLSMLLRDIGNVAEATTIAERAVASSEASMGPTHPRSEDARRHLAALRRQPVR